MNAPCSCACSKMLRVFRPIAGPAVSHHAKERPQVCTSRTGGATLERQASGSLARVLHRWLPRQNKLEPPRRPGILATAYEADV